MKKDEITMKECERLKGRVSNSKTSAYRYGCDICAESVLLKKNEGGWK